MARPIDASKLARSIQYLRDERHSLVARLTQIDALFEQVGITPDAKVEVTAAAKPKAKGRRGNYSETADQFILGLVKGKKLTTAEINAAWTQAGRSGKADVTLTKMVKGGKLKRRKIRGGRGSRYSTV